MKFKGNVEYAVTFRTEICDIDGYLPNSLECSTLNKIIQVCRLERTL